MNTDKAYFVDVEFGRLYQLSAAKRKQLEKKHPNWFDYDLDKNENELYEVNNFFKEHGKLFASYQNKNLFAGFVA